MSASKPRSSMLASSGRNKTNQHEAESPPHKSFILQSYDSTGDVTAQLNALRATLERSTRSTDLRNAAEASPLQLSTTHNIEGLDDKHDSELGRATFSSSACVSSSGSPPLVAASLRSSVSKTRSNAGSSFASRAVQSSSKDAYAAAALVADTSSMDSDEFKTPGYRPTLGRPANASQTTTSPMSTGTASGFAGSITPRSVRRALVVSQRDDDVEALSQHPDHLASQAFNIDAQDVQVGDEVYAMGFEGTLRYLGGVQFKEGSWGGIELSAAHAGKGKNNGSVQGIAYFSCPPNCGIFVPAQKISRAATSLVSDATSPVAPRALSSLSQSTSHALPTPRRSGVPGIPASGPRQSAAFVAPSTVTRARAAQSSDAARQAHERVKDGSKASAYLNLGTKRPAPPSRPTAQDQPSPRKASMSASVTSSTTPRPARSLMHRASLAASTSTAGQTPGGAIGPRRSLLAGIGAGPNTPTPAARRLPRSHTPDIPNVPPIPANLSMSTTTAPYSARGDVPLHSSTTPGRRQSAAAVTARPMTPSAMRPSSRASTASVLGSRSVSRASSRASMASTASSRLRDIRTNDDLSYSSATTGTSAAAGSAENAEALANAQRDAEQAKLELLEMHTELRDEKKRTKALQLEITDLKRKAQSSRLDEASAIDERAAEREQHHSIVSDLESRLQRLLEDLEVAQTRQAQTDDKTSDMSAEIEQLRSEKERLNSSTAELKRQVEQYKTGGKELLEIYEGKLAAADKRHVEDLEALQVIDSELFAVQAELAAARQQAAEEATAAKAREANSMEALVAASITAVRTTADGQSAVEIDNENLKAEVDHLKNRLMTLEEQLDESRDQVTRDSDALAQSSVTHKEAVAKLKQQVLASQHALTEERLEKTRLLEKADELQKAVEDSARTLESDRAELEVLRREGTQAGDISGELRGLRAQLSQTQAESESKASEVESLKEEIAILQEEVRLAEDIKAETSATPDDPHDVQELKSRHISELVSKNAEIEDLLRRLRYAEARIPVIAEAPASPAVPLSPSHDTSMTSNLSPSHASVLGHSSPSAFDLRTKRESAGSVFSAMTSISRKSSKDEGTSMRDEISGLKFIIKRGEDERAALSAQNLALASEASKLREAQAALEQKVSQMTSTHASIIPADASESRHGSQQDHRISELEDELSQMEAVMLARIQHEEMLESQLEDMKQALRDARRDDAVKPAVAATAGRTSPDGRASVLSTKSSAPSEQRLDDDDDKCEVCGAQHAVQDCPIFAPSGVSAASKVSTTPSTAVYCDDCESSEHDLKDCPLASEIW